MDNLKRFKTRGWGWHPDRNVKRKYFRDLRRVFGLP